MLLTVERQPEARGKGTHSYRKTK